MILPMKPAVSGIPSKLSRNIESENASTGDLKPMPL